MTVVDNELVSRLEEHVRVRRVGQLESVVVFGPDMPSFSLTAGARGQERCQRLALDMLGDFKSGRV